MGRIHHIMENGGGQSKAKVFMNTLFPSADSLSDRYVDAKKHKMLLPVAWTQRAVHHIKCKISNENEPDFFEKTKLVEERMLLIKELGL